MNTTRRTFIRHVPLAVAAALPSIAAAETSADGELLELMERHRVTLGICQALANKAASVMRRLSVRRTLKLKGSSTKPTSLVL
jgi:hypothetical protein